MELQAALQRIQLSSPDPLLAARFYSSTYGMVPEPTDDGYLCCGPGRQVHLFSGSANQLKYAIFALHSVSAWAAFATRVQDLKHQSLPTGFAGSDSAIALQDPDGNLLIFTPLNSGEAPATQTQLPPATLQHFALR